MLAAGRGTTAAAPGGGLGARKVGNGRRRTVAVAGRRLDQGAATASGRTGGRRRRLFIVQDDQWVFVAFLFVLLLVVVAAVHVQQLDGGVGVRLDNLVNVVLGFDGKAVEERHRWVLLFEARQFGLFVVQGGSDGVLGRVEGVALGNDRTRVAQVGGIADRVGEAESAADRGTVAEEATEGVAVYGGPLLAAEDVVAAAAALALVGLGPLLFDRGREFGLGDGLGLVHRDTAPVLMLSQRVAPGCFLPVGNNLIPLFAVLQTARRSFRVVPWRSSSGGLFTPIARFLPWTSPFRRVMRQASAKALTERIYQVLHRLSVVVVAVFVVVVVVAAEAAIHSGNSGGGARSREGCASSGQ